MLHKQNNRAGIAMCGGQPKSPPGHGNSEDELHTSPNRSQHPHHYQDSEEISEASGSWGSSEYVGPIGSVLYELHASCQRHKVQRVSGTLLMELGSSMYPIESEGESWEDSAIFPAYSSLEVLDLRGTFLGARQLMVLADVLRVELRTGASTPLPGAGVVQNTGFSLLPDLTTLILSELQLRFDPDGLSCFSFKRTVTPDGRLLYQLPPPNRGVNGNEAFLYFLEALKGHPSLQAVDLSGNALGPLVLPALSRLVKATPSLTCVHLAGTLLTESEQSSIAAQCELNLLRQQAISSEAHARLRAEWQVHQERWLVSQARARAALANTAHAHEAFNVTAPTPHVKLVNEVTASRAPAPKPGRNGSSASNRSTDVSLSDLSSLRLQTAKPTAATPPQQSFVYTTPYLRYYLTKDSPGVLGVTAMEVLRSAFVDPRVAQLTVFRGKEVPAGIPRPLSAPSAAATSLDTRANLREWIGKSFLLKAVRQVVLPEPDRPPSLFGDRSLHDPALRTTAEENYWTVLGLQEKQWGRILDCLVHHMHVARFTDGDAVYCTGDEPYWLTLVPHSGGEGDAGPETEVYVRYPIPSSPSLHEPQAITAADTATPTFECITAAGQFFGDVEILGGYALYTAGGAVAADTGRVASPVRAKGGDAIPTRHGTAVVRHRGRHHSHHRSPNAGSTESAAPKRDIVLWQIPLPVAFFYLYEPYHTFHTSAARALQLFPATRNLHPVVASMLAYMMKPTTISPMSTKMGKGDATASDSRVCANREVLEGAIILIESGDFTLGHYTPQGRWTEQALVPGSVTMNAEAAAYDEEARHSCAAAAAAGSPAPCATAAGAPNTVMGKAAALRQYREGLRRRRDEKEQSDSSTDTSYTGSAKLPPHGLDMHLCMGGNSTFWRFYTISNRDYSCLPQEVRLALTRGSVSI